MAGIDETPEFNELIERSSLGTDGARRLRARTPQSRAELVSQLVRHRNELATCRTAGDRDGELQALTALAETYHALGRDDEALALAPDPESINREPEAGKRAWALAALATVCLALRRFDQAEDFYCEMQAAGGAGGDAEAVTFALDAQSAVLAKRFPWAVEKGRQRVAECRDPLSARTAAEFAETLRQYWRWAGAPSYASMAKGTDISRTRLYEAQRKPTREGDLPSLATVRAFVTGCGGTGEDVERFVTACLRLWLEKEGHLATPNPPGATGGAVPEVPHDGQPQAKSEAASEEPSLVALDAFEEHILASDLPYADKAAAIRRHREQTRQMLAELNISEPPIVVPEFIRRAVRASLREQAAEADRDAG